MALVVSGCSSAPQSTGSNAIEEDQTDLQVIDVEAEKNETSDANEETSEGASSTEGAEADAEVEELIDVDIETVREEFNEGIRLQKDPSELFSILQKNIKYFDQLSADQLVSELAEYVETQIFTYDEQFFSKFDQAIIEKSYDFRAYKLNLSTMNTDTAERLQKLVVDNGYKVMTSEGMFYLGVDFDYLKQFDPYLSEEMQSYLTLLAFESRIPSVMDAGLSIGYDELRERLLASEGHIRRFEDSITFQRAFEIYAFYMGLYIDGTSNTAPYDMQTKVIYDELLAHYGDTVKFFPESMTAQYLKMHLKRLEENDYVYSKDFTSLNAEHLKQLLKGNFKK